MQTKNIIAIAALATTTLLYSCKKDKVENPEPEEQELITTLKLHVTDAAGNQQVFSYKVENGFDTPTPGLVTRDSVVLDNNKDYDITVELLNEKKEPAENITEEVIDEKDEHLFLYESTPTSGVGSITISNGDLDGAGKPFNQKAKIRTADAGKGKLVITLKHQPSNKAATTPAAAGGETDVEAEFDVRLK